MIIITRRFERDKDYNKILFVPGKYTSEVPKILKPKLESDFISIL